MHPRVWRHPGPCVTCLCERVPGQPPKSFQPQARRLTAYSTVSWSPDDAYIVAGDALSPWSASCSDAGAAAGTELGSANVWNFASGKQVHVLGSHRAKALAYFHPTRAMMATLSHQLTLWLPSSTTAAEKGDDDDVTMTSA